jgi:putative ABC transport system permease protein
MALLKLALKNITARPGRFILTSLAVLIGVALTSAVFVITDSWRDTFGALSEDIEDGYDLAVRSELLFGEREAAAPVPLALLDTVESVDGVAVAQPRVAAFFVVANRSDGTAATASAGPNIGINWPDLAPDPNLFLTEGRAPRERGEFSVDTDTAEDDGFVVGEDYGVQTPGGLEPMTLVGIFSFADPEDNLVVGAKLLALDTDSAVELYKDGRGYDDVTVVVEEGYDADDVLVSLTEVLPGGFEVVTQAQVVEETESNFGEIVDIFRTVLLVFAFVILLVAAFIIYNVFSIIVGQRIQEIGLLRALGATSQQITRSIAAEALGVGVFATVTGVLAGVPIAWLIQTALASADFGPPNPSTPLRPTTLIVGAILGIGITMVAAIWPALRAKAISPMAALRSDVSLASGPIRSPVMGSLMSVLGVALVFLGFALDNWLWLLLFTVIAGILLYLGISRIDAKAGRFSLVGLSVVLTIIALTANFRVSVLLALLGAAAITAFVGMNLVSPLFARPVARAIGAPFAILGGTPSRMARENAGRNPERTASAASALMIGLALVTTVAVVAESFKATFAEVFRSAVAAEWVVQGDQRGPIASTFPPQVAEGLRALPEVSDTLVVQFGLDTIRIASTDETQNPYSTDLSLLDRHFDLNMQETDDSILGPVAAYIHEDEAEDLGVEVGDRVEIEFVNQVSTEIIVAGIFADRAIFDSGWVIDTRVYEAAEVEGSASIIPPGDSFVTMLIADGVSEIDARIAIEAVIDGYSQLKARTRSEFLDESEQSVNQILTIINTLLRVSILLALLGIAITLALSVFERTREIGLVRAVGSTRKQVKRMIRVEGVIVALFGAVLGVGLGLVFGLAVVQLIPDDFVNRIAVPWSSMLTSVITALVAGIIASFFPARRAAKLNVLEAIALGE